MLCCYVPKPVRHIADAFKDLFVGESTSASYSNLCGLICMIVFGLPSLSALVRVAPWCNSVSDLSRSIDAFNANRFMRRLRARYLRKLGASLNLSDFCWAVDDTSNPKYGTKIHGIGRWGSSGGPFTGQRILVIALVDLRTGIALPAAYMILEKKGTINHLPAPKSAISLLKDLCNEGWPSLNVVTDSWFDSAEFISDIEALGLNFVGEIKSNRKVRCGAGRYVPWHSLAEIFDGNVRQRVRTRFDSKAVQQGKKVPKTLAERHLQIKKRSKALKVIAVYNHWNSAKAFGFWASSDRLMSGSRIWEMSRARWKIEELFRNVKQNLSFGKLPCVGKNAADVSICLPFAVLAILRLEKSERWGIESRLSIGEMLAQIRELELHRSLKLLIHGRGQQDEALKNKLWQRRRPDKLRKKPVDQAAEVKRPVERVAA